MNLTRVALDDIDLSDPEFWLKDRSFREGAFKTLRDESPFHFFSERVIEGAPFPPGPGYRAITRHDDIWHISRNPQLFCSGRGSNIGDLPVEMNEFFGSMINMDDPKHFRLRNIVSRGFTPKEITRVEQQVKERAEKLVTDLFERYPNGECDFVEEVAASLPLAIICDMMGNVSILVDHFGSPTEPTIAIADALRIVATQFNVIGPWLLGPGPDRPAETWARWPGFVLFVVVVFVARRRAVKTGDRELAGLLVAVAAGFGVAVLSILRLFGPYFEYTIRWTWILAALGTIGSGLALVRSMRATTVRRAPSLRVWLGGLVVASVVTSVSAGVDAKVPGAIDSRIVRDLVPQLEPLVDDDTVLLRFWDPYTLDATGFGTVLELERRGHSVRVDPGFAAAALPHRTAVEGDVDQIWWVVVGPVNDELVRRDDVERIAFVNPRSADEQARAERLLVEIEEALIATGRAELVAQLSAPGASLLFAEPPLDPSIAEQIRDLYLLGQPVGVYVLPEGSDVESLR